MRTIEIPDTLTVEYTVNECKHAQFNGTHKEVFDLSKLSNEGVVQYLAQTLVIKRQSQCRAKTADEKVKLGTWPVPEPGKTIGITEEGIQKTMKKAASYVNLLTEAEKKALAEAMGFAYIPVGMPKPEDADLEAGEADTDAETDVEEEEI